MKKRRESKPAGVADIELARQRRDQRLRNAQEAELLSLFRELSDARQTDFLLIVEALYDRHLQNT
jgi:hypothetical protein